LRKDFEKLITNYILNRKNLVNLFINRCKTYAQKIDLEFMEWCGENGVPFSIVFTKLDKLKPGAERNVDYKTKLLETWEELPDVYITSAEKKIGGDEILKFVEKTNDYLVKNKVKFQ
jgi:GTP-binding protein